MDIRNNPPEWLQWDQDHIDSYNTSSRQYKYVYGVKDIQVLYKEFAETSAYVSKPFSVDGNVVEVSLQAEEYNPATNTANRNINIFDTAVEYYIAFDENPTAEDWIPILPKSTTEINEMLLFNGSPTCKLRFVCDTSKEMSVYKNGIKLDRQYWSYSIDNAIKIDRKFDKYAIYTIQYSPDINVSSPWDINLSDKDRQIVSFLSPDGSEGELFKSGTDRNGIITLTKYPYVDYAKINGDATYKPISVSLSNANILGPNKKIYTYIDGSTAGVTVNNTTDYKYLSESILTPYDPVTNPVFEYYQDGRKICFTETFCNSSIISNMETNHGDAWVRIKYDYLRTSVRLKIILRNISNKDNAVTPVVRGYNLIFKVMR